jgi:hypothetical protein
MRELDVAALSPFLNRKVWNVDVPRTFIENKDAAQTAGCSRVPKILWETAFGECKFKESTVHGSSEYGERFGNVEPNRVA